MEHWLLQTADFTINFCYKWINKTNVNFTNQSIQNVQDGVLLLSVKELQVQQDIC